MSVVVPVYNSEGTLAALVERLLAVLPTCADAFEIILVDDGSPDSSWETICALAADLPHVRGLGLMRNYGQHNALLAGIRQARYDVVVTMDDDLQNPPEELPRLLEALADGADVVYGRPMERAHGLGRRLSSRVTRLVLKEAMGAHGAEMVSPFRAFRREIREGFSEAKGPAVNIDVLLSWSTTRFRSIPVRHDKREVGRSNYTLRRLVRHAMNLLTGFSTQPLRIASMTGFFFTMVGIGILVYVLTRYIQTGGQVHGFAFLASIVCVFAGAQMFTIGVIGEYMARMYHRMMEKP
ncbi:MAG TPA: glycosyltransferase family 2 protein, partial [Acidimicrobiales bacterium]|nr:glycosyltransferase family 2 protein [Acidimicrobiales bacterium]